MCYWPRLPLEAQHAHIEAVRAASSFYYQFRIFVCSTMPPDGEATAAITMNPQLAHKKLCAQDTS